MPAPRIDRDGIQIRWDAIRQKISAFISPRLLLLACPFILLAPVWLVGEALYWGTPSSQFIPWWWQAWLTIRAGEWPLWNPMLGMGAPLLANYQSALFYPPTWIYFGLAALGGLPLMAWGQAVLVAAHLAWAGWGMGSLIKRLGKSELAQTVGGLAFSLSGYLVARAHFLSINAAVAWLPWILLAAYDLAHAPRRKRGLLMLALFLGMQWLAGHAQIAWYSLLLATAWIVFWAARTGGGQQVLQAAVGFTAAGLLAFALAAVQLIPTAEYLLNSQRAAQVGFAQAAAYSFWPWRLLGLLSPNLFGNPAYGNFSGYGNYWEDAIYIGLLALFLALGALWGLRRAGKERPLVILLAAASAISLVLALGANTPLFAWLYAHVPSFSLFQAPTRFSIWLIFALALLAAIGVEAWRAPSGRRLYWSRLALAAAAALVALSVLALWVPGQVADFAWATLSMAVVAAGAAWLNLQAPAPKAASNRWPWLVCILLAADLLYAGWGLNPGADLELYQKQSNSPALAQLVGAGRLYLPENDERILKFERLFRFDAFQVEDPGAVRDSQLPNLSILDGLSSANNFDPLLPERYRAWIGVLEKAPAERQSAMLAAMGVTVIERVTDPNTDVVFESRAALPRARWVNCAQIVANGGESIEVLFASAAWQPAELILVEMPQSSNQLLCGSGQAGIVELISATPNKIRLQVDAPGGGWLVLADTWYPGWVALADGVPQTIYPADGLFRAVQLQSGQYHEIEFVYRPASFTAGLVGSALGWASWAFLKVSKRELG